MIETLLSFADDGLFFLISLASIYWFVFAFAANLKPESYPKAEKKHRYILLVPEGTQLEPQNYPEELYHIRPYKQLFETVQALDPAQYEMAVILGKIVRLSPHLLQEVNKAFDAGIKAIQLHSIIDNRSTRKLRWQAIYEEISHSLLKQGRVRLGLSSELNGTDMALELKWLQKNLKSETTPLERRLMRQDVFIEYLTQAKVYTPAKRIRRWRKRTGKLYQRLIPSWAFLLATTGIMSIAIPFYSWSMTMGWWVLLFGLLFTGSLAIPDYLVTKKKRK